jgi:hypothetical protein
MSFAAWMNLDLPPGLSSSKASFRTCMRHPTHTRHSDHIGPRPHTRAAGYACVTGAAAAQARSPLAINSCLPVHTLGVTSPCREALVSSSCISVIFRSRRALRSATVLRSPFSLVITCARARHRQQTHTQRGQAHPALSGSCVRQPRLPLRPSIPSAPGVGWPSNQI